ncbi:DNA repair protein RecN [Lentibacillus salicampi]|uniref:DNA repair protein RecN n=1 Tax=Lentibacillus salicampi TaxID=175306 RepID=A0A4Y9AFH6_9BACI|nr:DNA repair protein RecN [Lentibacillus salicampi]TFJ93720.1 DNA repair protein RecN [Lentibacillus salicampi]
MLTELSIQDFAIIDKITITFNEGLTVLTGETGAGKSIIIDAVQLLAGGRGSVEYVRHGAKKAEMEGLFTLEADNRQIYETADQYGIDLQDEMVVLHRTITSGGKSICRVNGKLVTLAILKEFGKHLIDVHSQHETQSLLNPDNHIQLLDLYDEKQITEAKKAYTRLYEELTALRKRYSELSENEQEISHRLDLLNFQQHEIEQANLLPNEDDQLEEERSQLANFEHIYNGLQDAYSAIYGEQRGLEWLNIANQALQNSKEYDTFISKKAEEMSNHYFLIEELMYELRNYADTLEYDPGRLNDIESRLNEISRLKKKYGPTVNDILEYLGKIEEEIEQITDKDSHLSNLETQIDDTYQDAYLEAKQLHDLREKAAQALTQNIHQELKDLYLEKTSFSVLFNTKEKQGERTKLHHNGFDDVQFQIATNPGEPLKPLHKVASGGELSRIMLALKEIFARHQGITSVIFDEVDTGVSGRVAQAIAEKIQQISSQSQVLCITHLPQVAAMADTHKRIQKYAENHRSSTIVAELSKDEKINELGRMITGTKLTDTAKSHATELLELACNYKKNSG